MRAAYIHIVLVVIVIFQLLAACSEKEAATTAQVIIEIAHTEENKGEPVQLYLRLTEPSAQPITVEYSYSGSAIEGDDFTSSNPDPLVFAPNQTELVMSFDIIDDAETEGDEEFVVMLSSATNATLKNNTGTVTIYDDEIVDEGYKGSDSHAGKVLVWEDDFTAQSLDLNSWTYEIGTGSGGWGNNELQYYTDKNGFLKQGFLVIEAREEYTSGSSYSSSRIITKDKRSFQYGRIDIRARMPKGQGYWPALWMLGANFESTGWPACGEIDIMEMIGGSETDNVVHGTCHWDNAGNYAGYGGNTTLTTGVLADEFHVFSIDWDDQFIRWYLDDVEYHVIDISPAGLSEFQEPFFFIFNVAVGGNWPGDPILSTRFPQRMMVDYVRVYQ